LTQARALRGVEEHSLARQDMAKLAMGAAMKSIVALGMSCEERRNKS
jgi:hypothetical protein